MAADLQTLMSDLQSGRSPNARTASTNPSSATGQTEHHHHHHHHGGEASGARASASSGAPSGAAAAPAGSAGQAVSQLFAADIAQALKAYGGANAAPATPALTT
jgi:hypothetical protein